MPKTDTERVSGHVGINSDGLSVLILGVALVTAAMVLYRFLPKLDNAIEQWMFGGRQLLGRRLRVVGGPILVGALGLLCVVAGVVKLVNGH